MRTKNGQAISQTPDYTQSPDPICSDVNRACDAFFLRRGMEFGAKQRGTGWYRRGSAKQEVKP